jgi:hypothetical protein
MEKVESLATEIAEKLKAQGLNTDVLFAILGRTCLHLTADETKEKEIG